MTKRIKVEDRMKELIEQILEKEINNHTQYKF